MKWRKSGWWQLVGANRQIHRIDDALSVISTITAVVATVVSLFLLRQGQADRRALRVERAREQAIRVQLGLIGTPMHT